MNLVITTSSILFIALIGFLIINLFEIFQKKRWIYKLGFSFGLGAGILYLQMYIYSRFGIDWNNWQIILPWLILLIINFRKFKTPKIKFRKISFSELFLALGIFMAWLYTIFEALIRPLYTWDGWANWILKSNAFFIDKGISSDSLQYIKSDGPLLISTIGSFIYLNIRRIDDTQVLLISTAYYIFLNILFFAVVREKFSLKLSLLFTFFLATSQAFIRQGGRFEAGQADLALGYYFFASTVLLLEYMKNKNVKIIIFLSFLLAIITFTKFDGLPFFIIVAAFVIFEIYKNKAYSHLLILGIWTMPIIEWQIFKNSIGLSNIYFGQTGHYLIFSKDKIINAIFGSLKEIINFKTWAILWITYFFTFFFERVRLNKELIIINILILSQLLIYILLYLFTFGNDPQSSIQRLLTHVAPLALFEIALAYKIISK